MAAFKIGICEPDHFSEKAVTVLSSIGEVSRYGGDRDRETIKAFISDKDAIFVRLLYKIDDDLLSQADRLKYICSPTTGLNHISVSDDYRILSLKGEYDFLSTIRATPEHVFGLSLSLLRNYKEAFRDKDRTEWDRDLFRGYELYQNRVGIIGMGRIGRLLVKYYKAFGAEVFYYDIKDIAVDAAVKCDSIKELCKNTNIILLEADYQPGNRKMIGRKELEYMQGKYFINAARGELVDEDALIEMINEDYFSGVAIDVLDDEAGSARNKEKLIDLTKEHNLIITPHIGGATYTSMERTEEYIAEKLKREVL